jgi:hypothetical protein
LEWKSRKRVLQRVNIRPGWGDFLLDWIAWPVFGVLPFILAYDNKIVEWLYIPNGYLCMMAAIGAIHTLVLLLAGYAASVWSSALRICSSCSLTVPRRSLWICCSVVGIKGVQSLLDRRLRTLSGTETFVLKLICIIGMVLTLVATMLGALVASYRAQGPTLEAWQIAWEGIALALGRGVLSISTCFVSLAIFTAHTLLRFSPTQDLDVDALPQATAVNATYEAQVIGRATY